MKKKYSKPDVNVIEFTLNENVALNTCTVRAQHEVQDCAYETGMGDKLFSRDIAGSPCDTTADGIYCYYTQDQYVIFGS